MRISQRAMIVAFVLCFFYFFFLQLQAIWPFTVDDMYISLRYAKNWASGFGLVWNIGELPVEGYSNFLFVLLGRFALTLGVDPVVVLKSVGGIGLFLTCVALYSLSRFWFPARFALIPCIWLLAYQGQVIWSVSGLETTLYEALIAYSVILLFKGAGFRFYPYPKTDGTDSIAFICAGFCLFIASMTRPEAPALMMLFLCLTGMLTVCSKRSLSHSVLGRAYISPSEGPRPSTCSRDQEILVNAKDDGTELEQSGSREHVAGRRNSNCKQTILFGFSFIICFMPYFFWRWHFFGRLFPNPVYCKGVNGSVPFLLDKHYWALIWPFALLAVPAILRQTDRRHYFLWLPSILYGILLWDASAEVAFYNRLFLPVFVLMLPLALQGIEVMGMFLLTARRHPEQLAQLNLHRFKSITLYFSAVLLIIFAIPKMSLANLRHFTKNPLAGERLRENVIDWLDKNAKPGSHVALADSGLIPYRSSLNFIDSYCLNNAAITQDLSVGMYPRLCEQVLQSKPDIIILTSLTEKGRLIYTPSDVCLAEKLRSSDYYTLQASLSTSDTHHTYRYEIFQKRHSG